MGLQEARDAKAQASEAYDMARTQQEADRAQAALKAASAALSCANELEIPPQPAADPLDEHAFYFQVRLSDCQLCSQILRGLVPSMVLQEPASSAEILKALLH